MSTHFTEKARDAFDHASDDPDNWTVKQCAEHCGITEVTWRSYVSDGRAPAPLPGYDERRRRRWSPQAVRQWHADRPGAGARTDRRIDRHQYALDQEAAATE